MSAKKQKSREAEERKVKMEDLALLLDSLAGLPGADKAKIVESLSADTKTYKYPVDIVEEDMALLLDYLAGLPDADKARIVEFLSADTKDTKIYEKTMDIASKYIDKFRNY